VEPVPLDPVLVEALRTHRSTTAYNQPSDWIFASVRAKDRVPVWPSSLMAKHILPAVRAAKIKKHVSWHVFRHSYASLLKGNGEDIKVVQEAIRHANFQTTANIYVQAIPQAVRNAHSKVVEQLAANIEGADSGPIGPRFGGHSRKSFIWWALQDSNLRLPPCEDGTLPLS
jgi:integrase